MKLKFNLGLLLLVTVVLGTSIGLYVSNLSSTVIDINAGNFEKLVMKSDRPVLVAFTADW